MHILLLDFPDIKFVKRENELKKYPERIHEYELIFYTNFMHFIILFNIIVLSRRYWQFEKDIVV